MIRRPMTVCGGASVFAKYVDVRHTVRANAETGDDQRMGEVVHRIEGNTVRLGGSAVVDQLPVTPPRWDYCPTIIGHFPVVERDESLVRSLFCPRKEFPQVRGKRYPGKRSLEALSSFSASSRPT